MEEPMYKIEDFVKTMKDAADLNYKIAVTFLGHEGDVINNLIVISSIESNDNDVTIETISPNGIIKLIGIYRLEDQGPFDGWIVNTKTGEWSFCVLD